MRLFIALRPEKEMNDFIEHAQDSCRKLNVEGDYVSRDNFHLTLAFIGEYDDPDKVLEVIKEVSFRPWWITIEHIGNFNDIWWAGFEKSGWLETLVHDIRQALEKAGIPYDKKEFIPHVTIIRNTKWKYGNHDLFIFPGEFHAGSSISLMRSDLDEDGNRVYTEVASVDAHY